VQEPAPEQLPPLVIYKQAPRPETPPPLVIRERPPSPLNHPREPLIIERRVAAPIQSHPRKIIIENLPAPPPKPRDIILEKWLPAKDSSHLHATRPVYYQKSYKTMSQSQLIATAASSNSNGITCSGSSINGGGGHKPHQVYEIIEHQHRPILTHYEYVESSSKNNKKLYKQFTNSSNSTNSSGHNHHHHHKKNQHQQQPAYTHESESIHSSDMLYAAPVNGNTSNTAHHIYDSPSHSMQQVFVSPDVYYTPSPSRKSKVAGYRIIRQIIPGPNSTPADIEKALARSQRISTVYPTPNVTSSGSSSTIQKQYHNKVYSPTFDMNASFQSPIYSGNSQQYEYFYSPKQIPNGNVSLSTNSKYVIGSSHLQPPHGSYVPHAVYNKTNVFRSTSIDNF
jgi:hypothetical protein